MTYRPLFRITPIAALLATVAAPTVHAQTLQSASCNRLATLVTDAGDRLAPDFADAGDVARSDDGDACTLYVARVVQVGGIATGDSDAVASDEVTRTLEIERQATIQGEVNVTLPDPEVNIEQAPAEIAVRQSAPDVTIDQAQPTIIVRQAQPTIRVQMAQPTITVEQPAPEIIVTMPEPGVNVASAQPIVEVNIPEPRVTVRQGEPMLNVDLDTQIGDVAARDPDLERLDENGIMTVAKRGMSSEELQPRILYSDSEEPANVSINEATPSVEYVSAEPNVLVESDGEPTIELIRSGEPKIMIQGAAGEQESAAVQPLASDVQAARGEQRDPLEAFAADPSDAAYDGTPAAMIRVNELDGLEVINGRGEELGEVERVVRNGENDYVIVEHGGWFFGLNDKEVAFPLDNVLVRGDSMVLRGMTEAQIEQMPDYDYANEVLLGADDEVAIMNVVD